MAFISSADKRKLGQLKAARVADPFYNDCGQQKTCFGSPDGCLSTQDCSAVMAVKVEGTRYLFEMKGRNAAYVAVGISEDQKMVRKTAAAVSHARKLTGTFVCVFFFNYLLLPVTPVAVFRTGRRQRHGMRPRKHRDESD